MRRIWSGGSGMPFTPLKPTRRRPLQCLDIPANRRLRREDQRWYRISLQGRPHTSQRKWGKLRAPMNTPAIGGLEQKIPTSIRKTHAGRPCLFAVIVCRYVEALEELTKITSVQVSFGCGLAYISFKHGQKCKNVFLRFICEYFFLECLESGE